MSNGSNLGTYMCPRVGRDDRDAVRLTVTWRNDNPATVSNRLAARLGREPTQTELVAEVRRILREARLARG